MTAQRRAKDENPPELHVLPGIGAAFTYREMRIRLLAEQHYSGPYGDLVPWFLVVPDDAEFYEWWPPAVELTLRYRKPIFSKKYAAHQQAITAGRIRPQEFINAAQVVDDHALDWCDCHLLEPAPEEPEEEPWIFDWKGSQRPRGLWSVSHRTALEEAESQNRSSFLYGRELDRERLHQLEQARKGRGLRALYTVCGPTGWDATQHPGRVWRPFRGSPILTFADRETLAREPLPVPAEDRESFCVDHRSHVTHAAWKKGRHGRYLEPRNVSRLPFHTAPVSWAALWRALTGLMLIITERERLELHLDNASPDRYLSHFKTRLEYHLLDTLLDHWWRTGEPQTNDWSAKDEPDDSSPERGTDEDDPGDPMPAGMGFKVWPKERLTKRDREQHDRFRLSASDPISSRTAATFGVSSISPPGKVAVDAKYLSDVSTRAKLGGAENRVLRHRYEQDLTQSETARLLRVSRSTVNTHEDRALRKLRNAVSSFGDSTPHL